MLVPRDVVYGWRGFRKQPGFTIVAVVTLGLGIGAVTTIFSAIFNILLNPFPYTSAERVVSIQIRDLASARPFGRQFFQVPEFLEYQAQMKTLDEGDRGYERRPPLHDRRRH